MGQPGGDGAVSVAGVSGLLFFVNLAGENQQSSIDLRSIAFLDLPVGEINQLDCPF